MDNLTSIIWQGSSLASYCEDLHLESQYGDPDHPQI